MTDSTNNVSLTIDEANKQIQRGEALERLMLNPDFLDLFMENYCKEEPARLASLVGDIGSSYRWSPTSGSMSIPPKEFVQMQQSIEKDIHAVGAFQSFLRVVAWKAEMSRQALDDIEASKHLPVSDLETTETEH